MIIIVNATIATTTTTATTPPMIATLLSDPGEVFPLPDPSLRISNAIVCVSERVRGK